MPKQGQQKGPTMTERDRATEALNRAGDTAANAADALRNVLSKVGLTDDAQRIYDAANTANDRGASIEATVAIYRDGEDEHAGKEPGYRERKRREALEGDAVAMFDAVDLLPDFVAAVEADLTTRTLPADDVRDYVRTKDGVQMVLDSVDAAQPGALARAMIDLVDSSGIDDDSDVARLLASSWGRMYAQSRGAAAAYDALVSTLRGRAAQRGGPEQRKAAQAFAEFSQHAPTVLAARQVASMRAERHGITGRRRGAESRSA